MLLNFDSDNKKAGYRLKYLQVYNWGLYDNEIFTVSPDLQSSLLIGGNASGKTTLIDALLTLFLSNPKYNLAGDAQKKRDRDITSYILGYFSEITNQKGEIVPLKLRKKNEYSIILATFHNNGLKSDMTIGQFFWFRTAESRRPERLYFLSSNKALRIEDELFLNNISAVSEFKKRLERLKMYSLGRNYPDRKGFYTDKYSAYSDRFAELFGLRNKDKALNLFNQTVSLKNIGNLNNFIRNEMLEDENIEPAIEKIKKAFDEAKMFSDEIQKAERKIKLLKPITEKGEKYKKLDNELQNTEDSLDILPSYFANLKKTLTEKEKQEKEAEKSRLDKEFDLKFNEENGQLSQKKEEKQKTDEQITDIENNTGISKRKSDILLKESKLNPKKEQSKNYKKYASEIGFDLPENEDDFISNKTNFKKTAADCKTKIEDLTAKNENFLKKEIAPLENKTEELEENIQSLKENKASLLEREYENARQQIADFLKIDKKQLPFICELIKVKDEEKHWQNSIEKLMRNFGLSLLVEEKYYNKVSEFIDKTTFTETKVRFYKIVENANIKQSQSENQNRCVCNKIEIKPEINLVLKTWIENRLSTQFNHLCCDEISTLQAADKAVTLNGLIKTKYYLHEKDDTEQINSGNYILGWDNSEKIVALQNELQELQPILKNKNNEKDRISETIKTLGKKQSTAEELLKIKYFSDIDFQSLENEIAELKAELKKLKENPDLEHLKENAARLTEEIKNSESEKTKLIAKISELTANIKNDEKTINDCQTDINTASPEEQKAFYPLIQPLITTEITRSNQISGIKNNINKKLKAEKIESQKLLENLKKLLEDVMLDFKHEFPDDMKKEELRNEIEFLDEFKAFYNRLIGENLSELKEKFDEKLKRRSDRVIQDFWMILEKQKTNIENKTGKNGRINELLKKRHYQENKSYLQIIPHESKDEETVNFKKEVKSCFYPIGGNYTPEEKLARNKTIFENIKTLLEKLEKYNLPGERWANKVTDVRNWFYFTASERDIDNPNIEIKAHSGTASKSGGETFKITYTILASAIADEFGLVGNQTRTNSLRFIAVDEIFNNLGVQWSTYVLKMFEEMDLQLLIVSPDSLEKANIAKDHIQNVHWTYKKSITETDRTVDNSYVVDIKFDELTRK